MSFARPTTFSFIGSSRPMGPGDFIWLAALGCASRGPTTAQAVCSCIDHVAAGQWAPSPQLVCDCLDEMARAHHLRYAHDGRYDLFTSTTQGLGILRMMLSLPIDRPTAPLGQVGLRLKLAFLDLATPEDRSQHLRDLIEAHREELARRPAPCHSCQSPGCFGRMWGEHHTQALRRDLELLERMQAMSQTQPTSPREGCSQDGLHINCILN